MTLRIAFDATYQRQPDGGIARYARQLTTALLERGDVDVVEIGGGPSEKRGTIRRRAVTLYGDFVWHPLVGRLRAASANADVYHSPGLRGPLTRGRIPIVVTVHDLVPFLYPELISAPSRAYTRATLKRMTRIADRVLCNSHDTADDIERLFRVPAEKLRVTPLGIDSVFFQARDLKSPVSEPYVLFIGSEQPRKNLDRLTKAVAILRARGFPHILVTAGADAWGKVGLCEPFVRKLGHVSEVRLLELYAGAECLALPSLHEGFGLPALEAMAVGTPVVAASVGALPEVTGGAAAMVNPLDPADIADGIERVLSDRDHFIALGRRRAAQFTWDRTAALTVDSYRELV